MHFKTLLLITVASSQHLFAAASDAEVGASGGAGTEMRRVPAEVSAIIEKFIPYVSSQKEDLALSSLEAHIDTMDQKQINDALCIAAFLGHQAIVEVLLNRPEGQVRPDQIGINKALFGATRSAKSAIFELLLDRPEGQVRPDQEGMNTAFIYVELYNSFKGITLLIANGCTYDDDFLRPYLSKPAVVKAIRDGKTADAWRKRRAAVAVWHYRNFHALTDSSVVVSSAEASDAEAGASGGASSESVDDDLYL